jgi:integrase
MAKGFTDVTVRNLRPAATRREVSDRAARGLYLVIQPSGVKTFAVRYRFLGKNRKLTLTRGISLAAARKSAADALFELEQGRDPAALKRQAKQAQRLAAGDTFENIAAEYFRREGDRLRSADWQRSALQRLILPTLGPRLIGDIRRSEVIRLLDRIEEGAPLGVEGGPVMADRALAIVRKVMNWHAIRSDTFSSPIVKGMARTNSQERARDRILTDAELRAVWRAATAVPFGLYVRFLLLTAARRTEVSCMRWAEVVGADWVLPSSRNKVGVELVRPLSAAAQDVLANMPRVVGGDYVFSNNGLHALGGLSRHKSVFDKACGVRDWVLHDLRRTARSLMSRAGVNSDHAERCLGHVIGGVRGVYDRHEFHREKLQAFEALAMQIECIVHPQDNVTTLAARG